MRIVYNLNNNTTVTVIIVQIKLNAMQRVRKSTLSTLSV